MKPAPFSYFAPTSIEEALLLLNQHGDEAKILAGGQSLVPTMNFRLAQPAVVIDINRIRSLFYVKAEANGGLQIGAMSRQVEIENHKLVRQHSPLLHETIPFIGHPQIRNRGTIGGSIAHADPAAELPAIMVALQAQFLLKSKTSERTIAARDFFEDLFTTVLEPEELLVEIQIPAPPLKTGYAFMEVARRLGDYALVGVAASITVDDSGACENARIVLLSVGSGPVAAEQGAALLPGSQPNQKNIQDVARLVAEKDIDPNDDIHASASFRRHLAKVLTERALMLAAERARST